MYIYFCNTYIYPLCCIVFLWVKKGFAAQQILLI